MVTESDLCDLGLFLSHSMWKCGFDDSHVHVAQRGLCLTPTEGRGHVWCQVTPASIPPPRAGGSQREQGLRRKATKPKICIRKHDPERADEKRELKWGYKLLFNHSQDVAD